MSGNTSATGGYLTPQTSDIDDDALADIFTAAFSGITGIDNTLVRPKWQTNPPKYPDASANWCAVGVTESDADAGPVLEHDPDADGGLGQDVYIRHKDITVLASFYGPASKGNAELLKDGLAIPQNLEALQLNSISFISAGTIRAVPESINLKWVTRYDMLVYFRRMVTRNYAVQNIDSADVGITIDDIDLTVNIEP